MIKKIMLCSIIVCCTITWAMTFSEYETFGKITKPANQFPATNGRFNNLLMILESTSDSIGLYDPQDGTFLRNLCKIPQVYGTSATPICATQGPDNNIYASDQIQDAVFMFDTAGNYLGVYADNTDGLDNVRGIAFRGTHLFITCGSGTVSTKEFSGPHAFVRNFIQDASDPFDIYFLPNGKALLADIASTTDNVRIYDTNGVYIRNIFTINFPEQIQADPLLPGDFLVAGFSTNNIQDFDTTGTVYKTWPLSGGRGVYRLGNGNILGTYGSGIVELDSSSGAIVQNEHGGAGRYIEFYHATGTSVSEAFNNRIINIDQIYPNPFTSIATIKYNLTQPGAVIVKIYNCLGREIRTLTDGQNLQGKYSVVWNGKDDNGRSVSNGIYICQIKTQTETSQRQIILVK